MGRIFRHRAGRRTFVGVLALAGLALGACEPLKQPRAPPPPGDLPQICIPNTPGDPRAEAQPAPTDPGCTPICLPGQQPPADPGAQLTGPPATDPPCVPICQLATGGGNPQANAALAARQRCINIPVPCLPGVDIPGCVNFCPPGQDPQQPMPNFKEPDCMPLCTLLPPGTPGSCSKVPDPAR